MALLTLVFLPGLAWANCGADGSINTNIDRINSRYDDFFRHRRDQEERDARSQVGVEEVLAAREAREKRLEEARATYSRVPKDEAREEALRVEWEKGQKQRQLQMAQAANCEVDRRSAAEEVLKRGRKIPEMKEYELEDY